MRAELWSRVKELFEQARERPAAERPAFLAEACAGDSELRGEVESLLVASGGDDSLLDHPPDLGLLDPDADQETGTLAGRTLGPWRLVSLLGRGGMGAVYLAERAEGDFEQRVAVKLVKRGLDTDTVLERFRQERQILASLEHPHIARLLDGGATEEGLPYFVMEHVEGAPLDRYCDDNRLPTTERLELFRVVCAAVQYAHQNLIVHRDLKPGNILVTEDGVPKLLDFGIAKLLGPDLSAPATRLTLAWARPLTPEYASPEQLRGEPVSVASDVYSLGVLLYQLLTGHLPYRLATRNPEAAARLVADTEPPKPSTVIAKVEKQTDTGHTTPPIIPEKVSARRGASPERLRRRLAGDLDNIVLKALAKQPGERYASVERLAEDLRRHLEGQPVAARGQTPGYRMAKFVRRNRSGVAAAGLVLFSLLAGIAMTARESRIARAERARAERRLNDVRQLANTFLFEFHDAIQNLSGSTPARELVVKTALEYLDRLAREAGDDRSLLIEVATAYRRVGSVQGGAYVANLGDSAGALHSLRRSEAIFQALLSDAPDDRETQLELNETQSRIAIALEEIGDLDGAMALYGSLAGKRESLAVKERMNREFLHAAAANNMRFGELLELTGDSVHGLAHYRRALEHRRTLLALEPTGDLGPFYQVVSRLAIGNALLRMGDAAGALEHLRQGLATAQSALSANPGSLRMRRLEALLYRNIGATLEEAGDFAGALESYRQGHETDRALSQRDPTNVKASRHLAKSYTNIGDLLVATGDLAAALDSYRAGLAIYQTLSAGDPANYHTGLDLALCQQRIGRVLLSAGRAREGLEPTRQALILLEHLTTSTPENVQARHDLASSYVQLGESHSELAERGVNVSEHWSEARRCFERGRAVLRELGERGLPEDSEDGRWHALERRLADSSPVAGS